MLVGMLSNKVRQSAPKPPSQKCSPPLSTPKGQRGRKVAPKEQVPLVAESIIGLDKQRFPHIPNEVWNALSATIRSLVLALLQLVETFCRDSHNDPLVLIQETIPRWTYQAGIAVVEATLIHQTGYLGSRLNCECGRQTLRFKGYAPHTFKTALGTVRHKRAYYHCECCNHSAYPMDHELGLDGEHRMVPQLQETMALMSARMSYPEALDIISKLLPVKHCLKLQETVTHTIAAAAKAEQEREHAEAFLQPKRAQFPKGKSSPENTGKVAAIAVDGGYCPMKGKNEPAREFKLGVLGWLKLKPRAKPEEEPPEVSDRHYTGTFKGCDYAMELTELEFHRMGLNKAQIIQIIGDGAEWIWNRAKNFKTDDDQELVLTLDLYHARERVNKVASEFFGFESSEGREWYKARDAELIEGRLPAFFAAFTLLAKEAEPKWEESLLRSSKRHRRRSRGLSMSEMMTILVFFHCSGFRNFKWYYFNLMKDGKGLFPGLLSYQRFVALSKEMVAPLCAYVWQECRGENTGISFIDSTKIEVCGRKRISKNKVFQGLAGIGKSSVGWFYGFKLHLVINDRGELLSFAFTPGNVDDRKPVPELTKELEGRLYGDKGYISKCLFEELMEKGLKLVTSIRRNMKNKLVEMVDKILLRKRAIIETVNDQLKNLCQLEHTRHRSVTGFMLNALSALAAYSHRPRKPSLTVKTNPGLQP